MANCPSQKLLIEGHCNERGSDEYNLALGDQRACAVDGLPDANGYTQQPIDDHQLWQAAPGLHRHWRELLADESPLTRDRGEVQRSDCPGFFPTMTGSSSRGRYRGGATANVEDAHR